MSVEQLAKCKRSMERFLGRFPENNIWFVAYPFFKIFKLSGFCPVKLSLEKVPEVLFYRDPGACCLTVLFVIGITIGFGCGVHDLSHRIGQEYSEMSTVIPYITNWAQIYSFFVMGCIAVISSWTKLINMKIVIEKIRQIDVALEETGAEISYGAMRKKLFIQTGLSFMIPTVLSMVNCMMIKSSINATSACYWFVCFAPMLLLTFKELKFYNLMFLLKGKFELVNQQIAKVCESRFSRDTSIEVISKSSSAEDGLPLVRNDSKLIEHMRALSDIYSEVADCVDSVLNIFAIHLLATTCTSFAVITVQSYNLFALVMHSLAMQIYEIVFTVAWIIVQIMVIGVNVMACSQTSNAMAKTGTYLHRIRPKEDYGLFLQVVQLFSLEILHRRKPLTAAGFFEMNFKLFTSIVAAVTTYLIIIIQFHLANVKEEPISNTIRP